MQLPPAQPRPLRAQRLLTLAILLAAYFALRLPHLGRLPIFCDEATYLRWAQLAHDDPLHFAFISLQDAKFPLHTWLLAIVLPLTTDPVLAGRLLSVLAGAAMIPLLFPLAKELTALQPRAHPTPQIKNPAVPMALILLTSPLLAFFQRMALAESLLLLESLLLALLSLALARTIAARQPLRRQLPLTLLLALAWTSALLTKQIFSELLWLLPPLALLLHLPRTQLLPTLRRFLTLYSLATAVALALFLPFLLAPSPYDLHTRLLYKSTFFDAPAYSRTETLLHNLRWLLLPSTTDPVTHTSHLTLWPHNTFPLDSGVLYQYLTPPVLLLLLLSPLVRKTAARPTLFLLAWSGIILLPLIANHNFLITRYALPALLPLLLLAGHNASHLLTRLPPLRSPPLPPKLALASLLGASLLWPALATTSQTIDPQAPTLLAGDRAEYLEGPGAAIQQACDWLRQQAQQGPVTLLTGDRLGIQNDTPWILLSHTPNLQLLALDPPPPAPPATLQPPPAPPSPLLAHTQQWSPAPPTPVTLPPGPTFYFDKTHILRPLETRSGRVRALYSASAVPSHEPLDK